MGGVFTWRSPVANFPFHVIGKFWGQFRKPHTYDSQIITNKVPLQFQCLELLNKRDISLELWLSSDIACPIPEAPSIYFFERIDFLYASVDFSGWQFLWCASVSLHLFLLPFQCPLLLHPCCFHASTTYDWYTIRPCFLALPDFFMPFVISWYCTLCSSSYHYLFHI